MSHQKTELNQIKTKDNQKSDDTQSFDQLMSLALEVAEISDCQAVMRRTVDGLAKLDGIALARVWCLRPGDRCASCAQAADCPATAPGRSIVCS